jgi:WD40 repeat protein
MVRGALACVALFFFAPKVVFAADGPTKPVSFREQVAPILVRKCLGCHNQKKAESGLDMTTFSLLRKGGTGAGTDIIEPGDPEASVLIESVRSGAEPRMPYKLPPLSDAQVQTLESWIKQGAKFDGPSESSTLIASLVDPLRDLPKVALGAPAADPVTSLAFSPDGSALAAAIGRKVVLFDAATGKPHKTYSDHPGPLTSVRFTSDGKWLIAVGGRAGMFGAVTVWNVENGQRIVEARGHTDSILAAEVAPGGKTLATSGYDRLVLLWDLPSLKVTRTLKDHTDAVYALAFSPDGKALASASADRTVKLWHVASGRRDRTLSDATAELYAVAFLSDGSTVLAAGVDRSIRAWRVSEKSAELVNSAFAHDAAVIGLAVSADGKTLVSSGEDRDVKLWDPDSLNPRAALPEQPDWPHAVALSRDGKRLAVGRYDSSIDLYDSATGKVALALQRAPAAKAVPSAKPELARSASLNPPSPRGATRGGKVRVTLTGNGVGRATEVVFAEPGLTATIVSASKPDANRLDVDLTIAPDARVGLHRVGVITPLGVPAFQVFAVEGHPELKEIEPNDDPAAVKPVALPATLLGAIDKPGDLDHFRFDVKQGQQVVFDTTARVLGSTLNGLLSLIDDHGHVLTEATASDGSRDPVLTVTAPRDGVVTLRVADADFGGSGGHFYRITAASAPYVTSVFPLGAERGKPTSVSVSGLNLQGLSQVPVNVSPDREAGTLAEVAVRLPDGSRPVNRRSVVVADGPQSLEGNSKDTKGGTRGSHHLSVPGGVSGRIEYDGEADEFVFDAKKGERLIVEVFGGRLGSPIDPVLEIQDQQRRPVPRAVLKPVAQTEVAFRDHGSAGTGIRLTTWNNLAINDTVLIGREVTRIFALPKNPDDDCQFWADRSQRVGLLETTPEHHPMGQPIYKVEVHPAGTMFPPGGEAPVTLYYRNDDGGPGFDKDARLTFDPPADGSYLARVSDVRGLGGRDFSYHLVVRSPRPDFQIAVSPENPNIPRGGTTLVTVSLTRLDGFDTPVEVTALNLPPGISATPVRVERGMTTALISLTADRSAPAFSPPTWTLTAREVEQADSSSGRPPIRHELDPRGARGGWITVTPEPNLRITAEPASVVVRPGRQVSMKLAVERAPAFSGRVPIEVKNLPQGVRVLNIGLNGVLVTEKQTERAVSLYAEPWAEPSERPFFAVGKAESAGTEHSSAPISLRIQPATDAHASAIPARAPDAR